MAPDGLISWLKSVLKFRLKEQRFHPAIIPADLEQLSTIKEITGYVRIDGSHPDLTNLSFLRNLEVIHGRSLEE
jgi:Receptor L domain